MVSELRDGVGQGQSEGLDGDLRDRVHGEVRFDAGTRGAYWTDASNFRQVPVGVVLPRTPDAAVEAVAVCRTHGVPVLSRGGGTSLAGQATNAAVVLDWSKYCHRIEGRRPVGPAMTAVSAGGTGRAPGVLSHPAALGGPPAVLS